ncbi:tRNA (adenosine(37)-N6)-dimethylallyltransferase MiaA [Chitinispirillales bacterium ANBcel5]|uniref:tRNA (adenosine(37)-N6)-dimethylallyltransferase MiaA n=1 Tax=Cellulosispirillum alkaliphilum TaxID=3039283 RepID=UPI002A545791|nr:tRNA (adenosine(37)-N6)-dimethylallyltransferase MiaA [Chitinispirillales bacterium ANBcel5]
MEKIIIPVIMGPTAVGKTELALQLASDYDYEIISCDSRQIYRHMDIGTAKVSCKEREGVRHWLIDVLNPDQAYSAYSFAKDALAIMRSRKKLGKKTLICGGTGLYFYTLTHGMGAVIDADSEIRAKLQLKASRQGEKVLHEELKSVDPISADRLHPNDLQRIIRALEVYYHTGKPLSLLQEKNTPPSDVEFRLFIVTRPRDVLYERINRRVREMINAGLYEEFRLLCALGYDEKSPGMQCVGYKELFDVQKGNITLKEAIEKISQNSRRYAKRQRTWFRNKTAGIQFSYNTALKSLKEEIEKIHEK